MTEQEALTKWCPHARVDADSVPANRNADGLPDRGSMCLASGCMMWRTTSSQHGYCGLAGRPAA